MNKTTSFILLLVLAFIFLPINAQLNKDHNCMRAGDKIIKQQAEYVDPGEGGKNQVWDFRKLKTVNNTYTLDYTSAPFLDDSTYIMGYRSYDKDKVRDEDLIVGTEHYTMYYYQISNDSLLLVGHENPVTKLNYTHPIVLMKYPFNYGQSVKSHYRSEGLYSGKDTLRTHGTVTSVVDGFGKVYLPQGDSINYALRIKTTQTIMDDLADNPQLEATRMETHRWYIKGYRYPVFETLRVSKITDDKNVYSTSYYYPQQEHYYLGTDPDNLALLEELWNVDGIGKGNEYQQTNNTKTINTSKTVSLENIMRCKMYPNPVESTLHLDYDLLVDAKNVSFQIYTLDGLFVKAITKGTQKQGSYNESLDCSSLRKNNYILRITANEAVLKEVIIKK